MVELELRSASGTTFRFDAGALCLELLTTGGETRWGYLESLHTPADVAAWIPRSRLGDGTRLRPGDVRVTARDLAELRTLRAALWNAASALAHDRRPAADDLTTINAAAARPPIVPVVDEVGRSLQRRWATPATGRQVLSTIARDAVDLLTGPHGDRIRECGNPNCAYVFVDTSPPGQRRWCSMQRCGNRNKLREHRARQRAASRH